MLQHAAANNNIRGAVLFARTSPPRTAPTRQTIVNFPVKNLELRPYVAGPPEVALTPGGKRAPLPGADAIAAMPVAQLRALLRALHVPPSVAAGALERADLIAAARDAAAAASSSKFDLCVNVVHDLPPDTSEKAGGAAADPLATGSYRVHVVHDATSTWYEVQVRVRVGESAAGHRAHMGGRVQYCRVGNRWKRLCYSINMYRFVFVPS
jgi:hypothetical protein